MSNDICTNGNARREKNGLVKIQHLVGAEMHKDQTTDILHSYNDL